MTENANHKNLGSGIDFEIGYDVKGEKSRREYHN